MNFVLQPWQLLLAILAGWSNRQEQEIIEYLRTENQILKEKLGKRRILLTDDQRRRPAVKGKVLGRKVLESIGTLFTPDAILRWHRLLVAQKWDYSDRVKKKPGRPPVPDEIRTLVVRLAGENPCLYRKCRCGRLAHSRATSVLANWQCRKVGAPSKRYLNTIVTRSIWLALNGPFCVDPAGRRGFRDLQDTSIIR
jgi:hypothetical protein